jgi:hypothetical protein
MLGAASRQTLAASITATVIDGSGDIVHKATVGGLYPASAYKVFTFGGLANDMEVNESVDSTCLTGENDARTLGNSRWICFAWRPVLRTAIHHLCPNQAMKATHTLVCQSLLYTPGRR